MDELRYRTRKLAKRETILCIVREYKNDEVLEIQMIENLQRQNIETVEADAIAYLSKKYPPAEITNLLDRTEISL